MIVKYVIIRLISSFLVMVFITLALGSFGVYNIRKIDSFDTKADHYRYRL